MPLYLKVFNSTAQPEDIEKVMPDMMAYLSELKASGKLIHSGPFSDFSGGVDIFEAENQQAAEAIASKDPLVSNKLGTFMLKEWTDMIDQI
jgi:uncharacterized protein YciI